MQTLNTKLEYVIKPTRVNYINLYNSQRDYLSKFVEHTFQMKSYDGITLDCIYLQNKEGSQNRSIATIIYNHSHGSCKYEGSTLIKHCAEYDYDLCIYDSRACGRSGDSCIYFGFKEYIDLLYVIFKLTLAFNRKSFVLWGRSIGCNAVIQLYHTLVANEGRLMNKQIDRLKSSKSSGKLHLAKTTGLSLKKQGMYPETYNKLINEHLDTFLMHNMKGLYGFSDITLEFTINAVVLDSPYNSFVDFIKDNISKVVNFMSTILSMPLSHYLKSFYNKRLGIDLETRQNKTLVETMNVSSVFFISDQDEMIPHSSFMKLVDSYGSKFSKRNEPRVYNTKQRHGAGRTDNMVSNCMLQIITNMNHCNMFHFVYKHQSAKDLDKIVGMKSYIAPKQKPASPLKSDFTANLVNAQATIRGKTHFDPNDSSKVALRKSKSGYVGTKKQPTRMGEFEGLNKFKSFKSIIAHKEQLN